MHRKHHSQEFNAAVCAACETMMSQWQPDFSILRVHSFLTEIQLEKPPLIPTNPKYMYSRRLAAAAKVGKIHFMMLCKTPPNCTDFPWHCPPPNKKGHGLADIAGIGVNISHPYF